MPYIVNHMIRFYITSIKLTKNGKPVEVKMPPGSSVKVDKEVVDALKKENESFKFLLDRGSISISDKNIENAIIYDPEISRTMLKEMPGSYVPERHIQKVKCGTLYKHDVKIANDRFAVPSETIGGQSGMTADLV